MAQGLQGLQGSGNDSSWSLSSKQPAQHHTLRPWDVALWVRARHWNWLSHVQAVWPPACYLPSCFFVCKMKIRRPTSQGRCESDGQAALSKW